VYDTRCTPRCACGPAPPRRCSPRPGMGQLGSPPACRCALQCAVAVPARWCHTRVTYHRLRAAGAALGAIWRHHKQQARRMPPPTARLRARCSALIGTRLDGRPSGGVAAGASCSTSR
jgi:hypothetical protein